MQPVVDGGGLVTHSENQHQLSPGDNMEPTRKGKKGTPKKYVDRGSPDRRKEDRLQQGV